MSATKVRAGDKWADWTATGPAGRRAASDPRWWKYYVPCVCVCGTSRLVQYDTLANGRSRCCGCKQPDNFPARGEGHPKYQHGLSNSVEYRTWTAIRTRCANPEDLGAKGIKVCSRWRSFERFYSDMGPRPTGHRIARRDFSKDFSPKNCLWVPVTTRVMFDRRGKLVDRLRKSVPANRVLRKPA